MNTLSSPSPGLSSPTPPTLSGRGLGIPRRRPAVGGCRRDHGRRRDIQLAAAADADADAAAADADAAAAV